MKQAKQKELFTKSFVKDIEQLFKTVGGRTAFAVLNTLSKKIKHKECKTKK
jgi:hypothetical protein